MTASDSPQSALVVLRSGAAPDASDVRAGETPPDPGVAERAVAWFQGHGFETGPVVGISFAITAPESTFSKVFGATPATGSLELPVGQLDDAVSADIQAVSVGTPPDFGPGNP
jgi:hypothetical protein